MEDLLADDVRELLAKEKGDARILKQILRACQHDEVVSNYERNYVKKLAEKHLHRKPETAESNIAKSAVPDVVLPQVSDVPKSGMASVEPIAVSKPSKLNKKIIIVVGIALVIVISTILSLSNTSDDPTIVPPDIPTVPPDTLSVRTDLQSYHKGDLISISGSSPVPGQVNISITNHNGQLTWTGSATVKNNGTFSTLTIAGGGGWDQSGMFVVTVDNNAESTSSTFFFTV